MTSVIVYRQQKQKTKTKFIPRFWQCMWCGYGLQVTHRKREKKQKDYCNAYCYRAYYDFMKRLNFSLQKQSIALFSDDAMLLREEILLELIKRVPAKPLNRIFDRQLRITKTKITKNRKTKAMKAKEFIIKNIYCTNFVDDYYTQLFLQNHINKTVPTELVMVSSIRSGRLYNGTRKLVE